MPTIRTETSDDLVLVVNEEARHPIRHADAGDLPAWRSGCYSWQRSLKGIETEVLPTYVKSWKLVPKSFEYCT